MCLGKYFYLTFYTVSIKLTVFVRRFSTYYFSVINLKVNKCVENFITIFNVKVFLIFKKHLSILIAQFRFHELVHTKFCIFSSTMHGAINIKISSWNLYLYNLDFGETNRLTDRAKKHLQMVIMMMILQRIHHDNLR